jgi:hypothetical protein
MPSGAVGVGQSQRTDFTVLPPFASKEERMVSEALEAQLAPGAVLREMVRRPLFLKVEHAPALTVRDVLATPRIAPYNVNYTGGAWDVNASARNSGNGWI